MVVYNGDKKIFDYDIGNLEFGVGKVISTKNIKIFGNNESLNFIVDKDNLISEITKKNNIQILVLKE